MSLTQMWSDDSQPQTRSSCLFNSPLVSKGDVVLRHDNEMKGADKGKKKVSKGPKSCQNCRKSKQRCDIPDRAAVEASLHPQPRHLACHRCNVLNLPCTIDIALDERQEKYSSPQDTSAATQQPTSQKRARHSSPSPSQHQHQHPTQHEDGHRKMHVFDPHFSRDDFYYSNNNSNSNSSSHKSHHNNRNNSISSNHSNFSRPNDHHLAQQSAVPVIDIAEKLQSLRPYPHLSRICSVQPNFLIPSIKNATTPQHPRNLIELLEKHADEINWEEMSVHLVDYQLFMPFLGPFERVDAVLPEREELYLTTRLYLASLRTNKVDLQIDLIHVLRPQTLSCIVRGAVSAGEAAALVSLALYEPLLLVETTEEMQLDGSGLLAAASAASKALNMDHIPQMMHNFDPYSNNDPSALIRLCLLWIMINFVTGLNTLTSYKFHRPLVECTLPDLARVEEFCYRLLERRGPAMSTFLADQLSLLLLVVFRFRSFRHFENVCQGQLNILDSIAIQQYKSAQACLVDGNMQSLALAKSIFVEMGALRQVLRLPEGTSDMMIDYVEYETMQLHMFCIVSFTEACMLRIAANFPRPINLSTLVQRIKVDPAAAEFAGTAIGTTKHDMARKLITLFSNLTSRFHSLVLALPPAYTCSLMLMNIKTISDYVGGFIQLGSVPQDCLDDCESGLTVSLCRMHGEALESLSCFNSLQLDQAKGHHDFYRMAADISFRTSHAIHEWAAQSMQKRKNIDFSSQYQQQLQSQQQQTQQQQQYQHQHHHPNHFLNKAVLLQQPPASASIPLTNAISKEKDFETLLEDILSTPILFN